MLGTEPKIRRSCNKDIPGYSPSRIVIYCLIVNLLILRFLFIQAIPILGKYVSDFEVVILNAPFKRVATDIRNIIIALLTYKNKMESPIS